MTQVIHASNTAAVAVMLLGACLCAGATIAYIVLPRSEEADTLLAVSSGIAVMTLLLIIVACVAREICCRVELDQVRADAFERAESAVDAFERADGYE